ncbi:MAG: energy transducer TonB family protein [Hyphomicrobium sp.]
MPTLRIITWLVSLTLHVTLASVLLVSAGGASLDGGEGEDMFTVEQGIAIEGFAKLGEAEVATEAVEAEPTELSEERPAIEEVQTEEKVEDTEVITSEQGPEQEELPELKPVPLEQPRPAQVATIEQSQQLEVEEQQSSGAQKTAGRATEKSKYLGSLRVHLETKKVNPRSRQIGTVMVRFTVDSNGAVVSREVTSSSGHKVLDDAALAAIDKAAPFPAIPDEVGEGTMVVSVPFKFSVR